MIRNTLFLGLFLLSGHVLIAQAEVSSADAQTPSASAKEMVNAEEPTAKIQPSDFLNIEVYNEPDLSLEVQVDRRGFINYPLIGRIKVADLTNEEAATKIYTLLEADYLVEPIVNLQISKRPTEEELFLIEEPELISYILLGEVNQPGTYEFDVNKGQVTLMKAISIAGGFTNIANMKKIKLLRRRGAETKAITINAKDIIEGKRNDEMIKADDLIVIPESLF